MNAKKIITAMLIVFLCAILFWCCARSGGVYDSGSGAAAVADRIESAKAINNEAAQQREKAETGIAGAERAVDRIETGLEESADIIDQYAASIERCQYIIDTIRTRGKVKAAEN